MENPPSLLEMSARVGWKMCRGVELKWWVYNCFGIYLINKDSITINKNKKNLCHNIYKKSLKEFESRLIHNLGEMVRNGEFAPNQHSVLKYPY